MIITYSHGVQTLLSSDVPPVFIRHVLLNSFSFFPAGAHDKKQTDSVLDSFEYFHEKGKEKEDDLHKSYNDRSYLSSEEVGSGESRTGE